VSIAALVRPVRRVQRVGKQSQPGDIFALRYDLRGDTSAHRPAAGKDRDAWFAHGRQDRAPRRFEHEWAVRGATLGFGVWELEAPEVYAGAWQFRREVSAERVVKVRPGAGRVDEDATGTRGGVVQG
jgi:hypothetical protein